MPRDMDLINFAFQLILMLVLVLVVTILIHNYSKIKARMANMKQSYPVRLPFAMIAWSALTYFSISFILVTVNFARWQQDYRIWYIVVGVLLPVIVAIVIVLDTETPAPKPKKEKKEELFDHQPGGTITQTGRDNTLYNPSRQDIKDSGNEAIDDMLINK